MAAAQPVFSHETSWGACGNCSIRTYCPASNLVGKQLDKFESQRGTIRILRKGQYLFRSSEKFNSLYMLRSGMVKLSVAAKDGDEQITGFNLPGEILGVDGIENNHYCSTALALETSSVCVFPFERLLSLGNEFPAMQKQLWRLISHEISTRQELLLSIGHKDAEERIAGFLLTFSLRLKNIGYSAKTFHLPMSRHDIGNYLGMTVETVSRILTRFEKAGFIKKEKRNINLININALTDMCFSTPVEPLRTKDSVTSDQPATFEKNTFHGCRTAETCSMVVA